MFNIRIILASLVLNSIVIASVQAHALWDNDGIIKPRANDNARLKKAPCGGVARTNNPVTFEPGEAITVDWKETINHPGYYRIAFSAANDEGFDDTILEDDLIDEQEGPTPHFYSETITLPNIECSDCTLQLIQVMTENPNKPSLYYSCADIKLVAAVDEIVDPVPEDALPEDNISEEENNHTDEPLNISETNLAILARVLYEDFEQLDHIRQDQKLEFDEIIAKKSDITLAEFQALDTNGDGKLDKETELKPADPQTDLNAYNNNGRGAVHYFILIMIVLLSIKRKFVLCQP